MTARNAGFSTESVREEVIAGRYRVERELGRGGMATVFLCTDIQTGNLVALKLLRPELGSAVVVERFLREIRFASELEHPQIPKVLDSGVVNDVPFYTMTYVEGESLRAKLDRERQLPIDEVTKITQEVIKPISYAHAHGIIHRDVKPANILLSGDTVFVLDLGVARAIVASSTEDSLTSTGVAVGTPAYMSPEQALADHNIDKRSDIYSLGCVVYEMVAGIPPFVGATPQSVMARRFASPPPPLDEIREFVPPSLQHAIAKAMAKSPADRWQNLDEFGTALTGSTWAPSMAAQAVVLENKKKRYAFAVIAAIVLAVTGVAATLWTLSNTDHVAKGRTALSGWDFATAESSFRAALDRDSSNAQAQLWLAQLLMLKDRTNEEWKSLALRAADQKSELDPVDQQRAEALAAVASDAPGDKCVALGRLAAARPGEFTPSLSFADCMYDDRTVIPDSASPSRYRFRRSYAQIASIYEGLATRNARNPDAFRILIPRLENVLATNKTTLRSGVATNNSDMRFYAYPNLDADTIVYVPAQPSGGSIGAPDTKALERIIARNLARLENLARLWTKNAPSDPDGREMLAKTLEASGRIDTGASSALSEITKARAAAAATSKDASGFRRNLRLAATRVRLLVKAEQFDAAAALADSVLTWRTPNGLTEAESDAMLDDLAGLAALTGRLRKVITLEQSKNGDYPGVRLANGEIERLPNELARDAVALESYASLGAPADSIIAARNRISTKLASLLPDSKVSQVENALFSRWLALAAPAVGPEPAASLDVNESAIKAMKAIVRGDRSGARRIIDSMEASHSASAPGEVTIDVVFVESWLRTAVGDSAAAMRSLDKSLGGLTRASTIFVARPALAGALVRAMILRADLAAKAGDRPTADRWRNAAASLWKKGDAPMLQMLNQLPH
ncbi:MAG TPA: serine/threonine-protein kinase [Gemmatimonadaceae bacterium]